MKLTLFLTAVLTCSPGESRAKQAAAPDLHSTVSQQLARENLAAGSPLTGLQIDQFVDFMSDRGAGVAEGGDSRQVPSIQVGLYDSPGPATGRAIPLGNRIPLLLVHASSSDIISDGSLGRALEDLERWLEYVTQFNGDADFASRFKVYRFVYDTRLGIEENAGNLVTVLDNLSGYPGWGAESLDDRQFLVLSHSMGGIVARAAMNERFTVGNDAGDFFGNHVIGLVTLGTPHHGSPGSIPSWAFDTTLRGNTSVVEFVAGYIGQIAWTPNEGAFDLSWDNYDDNVPLQNIASNLGLFVPVMLAVGGGLDQHLEGLANPYLAALNQSDAFLDRLIPVYASESPVANVDTLLELAVRFVAGTLDEHHLLAFADERLGRIIAGDSGEGDLEPYQDNDGLVPGCSARFDGAGVAEVIEFPIGDHLSVVDDPATVAAVKAKLVELVALSP